VADRIDPAPVSVIFTRNDITRQSYIAHKEIKMGWGRTLLLGDIGNRLDIEDTERDIADLKREIAGSFNKDMSQDRKIKMLVDENAELKLYLAAVVRLLMSRGTISRQDLETMVRAIDSEDGTADGKFTGKVG